MNNELYEKLTKLQWLLHKQQLRRWAHGGPAADATRGQGRILAMLKLRDGISTKDLAYMLGVAVSSLNELLSKLEKADYIMREPSEQDKRVMLVRLTDKGRDEEQPAEADFGDIFDCLSDEEQEALDSYLDKVIAALGENLGFGDEEIEWLKEARAERERRFTDMFGEDMHGFGGFPHRPGPPHRPGSPHRPGPPHGRDFFCGGPNGYGPGPDRFGFGPGGFGPGPDDFGL